MKILVKYILKEFLKPVIISLMVFTFIIVLSEMFRIMNFSVKTPDFMRHLPFYLFYQTPVWVKDIIPISMLIGFLFAFNGLYRHNEITAIKASGVKLSSVFVPIIVLSLLVSVLLIVFNETLMPYLNLKAHYFYNVKIKGRKIEEKTVYNDLLYIGEQGRKYMIKEYHVVDKKLKEVTIDRFDKNLNLIEQIYAKEAIWKNELWVFKYGFERKFLPNGGLASEEYFKEKYIQLPEKPKNFKKGRTKRAVQMTMKELKEYIAVANRNNIPAYRERTKMHLKLASPFAATIVILIGMAFTSFKIFSGKLLSFVISIFISFVYLGFISVGLALGQNNILPPYVAAWLPNIFFLGVSIFCTIYSKRF